MRAPASIPVRALRAFRVPGRVVEAGELVELPLGEALEVITMGRASAAGDAAGHVRVRARAEWSEPERDARRARWDVNPPLAGAA